MEWLARCGVVPYVPVLNEAIEEIINAVDAN